MGAIGTAIGGWLDPSQKAQRNAQTENIKIGTQIGQSSIDAIGRAQKLADRPYQAYTGERVAGLSGNETQALNLAATGGKDARGYYDKAGALIGDVAGSAWNQDTIDKYVNPYIKNVVDQTLKRENTAYQQGQNAIRGQAATQGAFGGDRATLLEAAGRGKHLQAVGDITAQGYASAYNDAFQKWQSDNERKMGAARAYESVGGDISRLNSQQISDLLQTGQADRVIRQLTNDTQYSAFIEKRDWDVSNLQPLLSAISVAKGGQQANPQNTSNAAGDVLGTISTLVGFFGKNGGGGKYDAGSSGYSGAEGVNGGGVYYGAGGGSYTPSYGGSGLA